MDNYSILADYFIHGVIFTWQYNYCLTNIRSNIHLAIKDYLDTKVSKICVKVAKVKKIKPNIFKSSENSYDHH